MQSPAPTTDENHENSNSAVTETCSKQNSHTDDSTIGECEQRAVASPPPVYVPYTLVQPTTRTTGTLLHHIQCHCGQPARCVRVSKYGPTQGQLFWSCALPLSHTNHCKFFQWDNLPEAKRLLFRGRAPQTRRRRPRRSYW